MISYVPLRTNMVVAALIYAVGALICSTAPSMPVFLLGRVVEGLGGGALVSLAFVSVERLFPQSIWPQLFGIMSAVWGVAVFRFLDGMLCKLDEGYWRLTTLSAVLALAGSCAGAALAVPALGLFGGLAAAVVFTFVLGAIVPGVILMAGGD